MATLTSPAASAHGYASFAEIVDVGYLPIKIMVCRSWDVKNPSGKYIGTEYIFSDEVGKALHCIVRISIAHCVVSKLHAGGVYSIRRFTVAANKEAYRLCWDDTHLINLESNTLIHKVECSVTGFTRQPFILEPLEEISFNNHAFLIDVIGRPVNVGACKPMRNGSMFLDFDLMNER